MKKGYSTFEAISTIAKELKIETRCIGYAGLKDEDGVTEQHLSYSTKIDQIKINKFNNKYANNNNRFMKLSYSGQENYPLSIGNLCGNTFRVIIRNVDEKIAEKIYTTKQHINFFINYYGTQRFGLPKASKTTHIIGECIINKRYEDALTLLKNQSTLEGMNAKKHRGDAVSFFNNIDLRTLAFFQNSFYSYQWNENLKNILRKKIMAINHIDYTEEGISYLYLKSLKDKIRLLDYAKEIEYPKIRPNEDLLIKQIFNRPTLIQYNISCSSIRKDIYNNNKWCCEVSFFLPSGSYATIVLSQFLHDIGLVLPKLSPASMY